MRRSISYLFALLTAAAVSGCAMASAAALSSIDGPSTDGPLARPAEPRADRENPLASAPIQDRQLDVRLWIDGEPDLLQRGDRIRLRFRTSQDAYVAILHIDPEGELEFLFPYGPYDDNRVRGLRTHSLPSGEWNSFWTVSGRSGMGYFFIVAATEPLNFRPFEFGSRWDLSAIGSRVRGDPYWVFDQIARMLVPESRFAAFGVDHYGYSVGRHSTYPSFACYERNYTPAYTFWNAYYGSCDRVLLLLRSYPDYYHRRFRGDRRGYWRELERSQPVHGFKERADQPAARVLTSPWREAPGTRQPAPDARQLRPQAGPTRAEPDRPKQELTEPSRPERQRPVLERRSPERAPEPVRERPAEPVRERPAPPRAEPRREPPAPREQKPSEQRPKERPPEPGEAPIVRDPKA